jgi:hypothetical protein
MLLDDADSVENGARVNLGYLSDGFFATDTLQMDVSRSQENTNVRLKLEARINSALQAGVKASSPRDSA